MVERRTITFNPLDGLQNIDCDVCGVGIILVDPNETDDTGENIIAHCDSCQCTVKIPIPSDMEIDIDVLSGDDGGSEDLDELLVEDDEL